MSKRVRKERFIVVPYVGELWIVFTWLWQSKHQIWSKRNEQIPRDGAWLPGLPPTLWLEGWNVQTHLPFSPLQPPAKREGLEVELITNGGWYNQSCLSNEVSIGKKNPNQPGRQSFRTAHIEVWEGIQRGQGSPCPFSLTLAYASFPSAYSWIVSIYNNLVIE